jgi:prophage regulatory protein
MGPIWRIPEIKRWMGKGRSSIYQDTKDGLLPPFVKLGPRAVGLPQNELEAINAARVAGKTPAEIKALVRRLVSERATAR